MVATNGRVRYALCPMRLIFSCGTSYEVAEVHRVQEIRGFDPAPSCHGDPQAHHPQLVDVVGVGSDGQRNPHLLGLARTDVVKIEAFEVSVDLEGLPMAFCGLHHFIPVDLIRLPLPKQSTGGV